MSYETILIERRGTIGIIRLNRPQQRNALGAQLVDDVIKALHDFDDAPEVHVIVIMSNLPRVFSAGRDLAEGSATSLKKCLELFVTGDRFSAQEAESMGLVNKVVPPDKLEESTMELAQKIASKSPATLQLGKQFFYNMLDMEYAQATKYATEVISIVALSEDGQEGQRAFIEKREPQWKKLT